MGGRSLILVVLPAVLASVACYESAFPIDARPQADIDPSVVGTWRCVAHGAKATEPAATITVVPKAERVYSVTFHEDGEDADYYESYVSLVRGEAP